MMRKKEKIILIGVVLIVVIVGIVIFAVSLNQERQLPICSVERNQKMIAITFDAVWGNDDTQQIIDILGKYNVKATFFMTGDWVDKYPESAKALSDAGHEIMNHSNTHTHISRLSRDQVVADVEACNDKIEAVTGLRPALFRPPFDEYDDNLISTIRSIDMEPIRWDVDSQDQKDVEASKMVKEVTSKVQRGSIIRFHLNAFYTPEALPGVIVRLLQDGYTFVPVSQLLLPQPYIIDSKTGQQLPAGTESVTTGNAADYFDSARLNRQQARNSALSLLQQAAADKEADQTKKDEANASIQTMAGLTITEAQIEALVIAKGFTDCVAFIGDKSVSVVVGNNGNGLTDADTAKITEIVQDETGMTASQIKIIEANR